MGIRGQVPNVALGVLAGWSKQHLIMRMMQCIAFSRVSCNVSLVPPAACGWCLLC